MNVTLEEIVAANRIKTGDIKEYEDLCKAVRSWIRALIYSNDRENLIKAVDRTAGAKKKLMSHELKGGKFRVNRIQQHEVETARVIRGRTQPNSGRINGIGGKGDAKSEKFLADAKQTSSNSMSVKMEWIEKLCKDAWGLQKEPLFHLRWNHAGNQFPNDWVMVPSKVFEEMIDGNSAEEV